MEILSLSLHVLFCPCLEDRFGAVGFDHEITGTDLALTARETPLLIAVLC